MLQIICLCVNCILMVLRDVVVIYPEESVRNVVRYKLEGGYLVSVCNTSPEFLIDCLH